MVENSLQDRHSLSARTLFASQSVQPVRVDIWLTPQSLHTLGSFPGLKTHSHKQVRGAWHKMAVHLAQTFQIINLGTDPESSSRICPAGQSLQRSSPASWFTSQSKHTRTPSVPVLRYWSSVHAVQTFSFATSDSAQSTHPVASDIWLAAQATHWVVSVPSF